MLEGLKPFFVSVCDALRRSPGSLELITTTGTSILSSEGDYWIKYGASNFEEVYRAAVQVIEMIGDYNAYSDDPGQFMYDIMAVLDDMAFHASLFGVYFFSIEPVLRSHIDEIDSHSLQEITGTANAKVEDVRDIATRWDSSFQFEERVDWINRMLTECFQIQKRYETLFGAESSFEFSKSYGSFRQLYWNILTVQCLWKEAKQTGAKPPTCCSPDLS